MSRYFAAKLEIVVRQADKKMIATAPEIYLPRVRYLALVSKKYLALRSRSRVVGCSYCSRLGIK